MPEIDWFDPTMDDSYDMCPDSPYADHGPSDARGATPRYGSMR